MYAAPPASRYGSAAAAVALTAAMGWALLVGLAGGTLAGVVPEALKTFVVTPPPPPPEKTVERPHVSRRAEGRAAPPNIRSKATPVVAPTPVVPLPPPPIVAAPKPFQGNQATQGAALQAGPGTGAGGIGDGTGSGGYGDGDGDGGDETPPRWKKGRLKDSDYPHDAADTGLQGKVSVRFMVWTDGRVRDCSVTRSSGSRTLDDTTCRLITARYRYEPSRDAAGRPVPVWILETHEWINPGLPGN